MEIEEWLGKDNQLGIDIWKRKYCYKEENFEQWLTRISGGNEKIAQLIREKKFLFGGRILANRGLEYVGRKITLSNCYVIEPPQDEIESIFECAKKLARTYSYGGGCGIDISLLSPRGARINNAAKETSGAVSFMDLYSLVTELIGQNGRRGALMISIDCSHPDVTNFIDIKTDLNKVTKANISVRISREFMEAVKKNGTQISFRFLFLRVCPVIRNGQNYRPHFLRQRKPFEILMPTRRFPGITVSGCYGVCRRNNMSPHNSACLRVYLDHPDQKAILLPMRILPRNRSMTWQMQR